MFWKIFKHDFIKIYKIMGIFYALAIIFAILAKISFGQSSNAAIWLILGNIFAGGMWAMAVSSLINGALRALKNFRESIYGKGAFFTRCLPANMRTIFLEKFFFGALMCLTSIIVATTSAFIVYAPYDQISAILNLISSATDTSATVALIFIFVVFYIEILLVFSAGIIGIVLGHKRLKHKNLYAVFYGLLAYLLSQGLIVGSIAFVGIFESDVMQLFSTTNNIITPNAIKIATVTSVISYALCATVLSVISSRLIQKGVDID